MDLSIKTIIGLFKQYKLEVILTICLFSNLYPQFPPLLYYVAWGGLLYSAKITGAYESGKRANLAYFLIGLIIFSTIVNLAIYDYRWIMMCILLYITLTKTSYKFYKFKDCFIFICLMAFVITGPLNWYAHRIGYNYQLFHGLHAGSKFTIDFSGFTNNPMWLSAACGIGVITLTYFVDLLWKRKKMMALILLPVVYITLQTLVWGGSRSAFGISLASSLLYIWLVNRSMSKTFISLVIVGLLSSIAIPIIMEDSERMQTKKGGLNLVDANGNTSRTALWDARIEEFESSPIWGIGFGVTGIGGNAKTGRAETGSGWLSVLSQTGIIGIVIVLLLIKRAIAPIDLLRQNKRMVLYSSVLVFLCLHTIFEAYLYQSGWYLCLILWTIVSILDDYKQYYGKESEEMLE